MRQVLLLACLALAACGDSDRPFLKIQTGGISFDRNHTEAMMAVVVKALKPLPDGSQLAAQFEASDANRTQALPAQFGQLLYRFEYSADASAIGDGHFHVLLTLRDAGGKELERLEQDFGGLIDKHAVPRHSDMIPDRENQVRQYNDEGF